MPTCTWCRNDAVAYCEEPECRTQAAYHAWQDVLDALRQDYPVRNKPPLSQQGEAWSASTKLVSRIKALLLLGLLFYVVLPVTLAAAAARALLSWLLVAKPATSNGRSTAKHAAVDGHGGKGRGTAIVSGAWEQTSMIARQSTNPAQMRA